ncbi:MAG: histidinol-phosphatase [Bacilli bacterium]
MEKLIYNLHTHTSRCGHAYGTDEEYVKSAIKNGIKLLGFSDHIFFPNIIHKGMRGNYELLDDYISSILFLKKKYSKKVDIKLGFEAEYQESFYGYYKYLLNDKHFDYLILGQHLTYNIKGKPIYYWGKELNNKKEIYRYRDDLISGMKTGFFLYVAHPDLFMRNVSIVDDDIIKVCEDICAASKEYDVPLEINLGGFGYSNMMAQIEGGSPYPNHFFWKMARKYKCKCVIGVDAHNPKNFDSIDYYFLDSFINYHELKIMTLDEILHKFN